MTDMSDTHFDYYADRKHDHGHDHHAPAEGRDEGPPSEYEIISRAMQELFSEKTKNKIK